MLKNVGLSADLQARLDELRASRQRLVHAQDLERRRLERNLHDGAQQHLVALKVKLGLAEMLLGRDPAKAAATLEQLKGDADEALETLARPGAGHLPAAARRQGACGGAGIAGAQGDGPGARRSRRRGALLAGRRGDGVLLRARGAAERAEVRARIARRRAASRTRRDASASRCRTTAPASTRRPSKKGAGLTNMATAWTHSAAPSTVVSRSAVGTTTGGAIRCWLARRSPC